MLGRHQQGHWEQAGGGGGVWGVIIIGHTHVGIITQCVNNNVSMLLAMANNHSVSHTYLRGWVSGAAAYSMVSPLPRSSLIKAIRKVNSWKLIGCIINTTWRLACCHNGRSQCHQCHQSSFQTTAPTSHMVSLPYTYHIARYSYIHA